MKLKEVAELAGVSLATASMVINRNESVSFAPETVSRVFLAAQTLGYGKLNAILSPQSHPEKKKVIALFLPSVTGNYYTAITRAVNTAANQKGYDTVSFEAFRDPDRELRGLSFLSNIDIAGIIFTYIPHNYEFVEKMAQNLPIVVIGTQNSVLRMDMVETDNYRSGVLLAHHMLELGHRHVAFIATDRSWWGYPSTQRIQGVKDTFQRECPEACLTEKILNISSSLTQDSKSYSVKIGSELAESCLVDKKITGFIAVNDYLAYGIMDALISHGYRVPQDYSVCGCDDIFPSGLLNVNLTTVNHHISEKGLSAFDLLYRRMMASQAVGEEYPSPVSILRVEYLSSLVVRGTTARPTRTEKR